MRKLWHYTKDLVYNPEIVFKRPVQNADQCEVALDVNNPLLKNMQEVGVRIPTLTDVSHYNRIILNKSDIAICSATRVSNSREGV